MLADYETIPRSLPPGFAYLDEAGERFDARRHLALTDPDEVLTLADFGYDEEARSHFPSPVAVTSPIRVLSAEGVAAMERSIELCRGRMTTSPNGDPRLYFGAYQSRFMRDLSASRELTDHLGSIFKTPVAPHTMAHLGIQLNTGEKAGGQIEAWHHDQVSFTVVLSMYDPTTVKGGRLEYFRGTRDEGNGLSELGDLPADRVASPVCPPGYAILAQGSAVWHRASPLEQDNYRASLVLSFCARDATYPDGNRGYLTSYYDEALQHPDVVDPIAVECARHGAWMARARLGTLFEEVAWTDDTAFLVEQLRQAIAPVELAMDVLSRGKLTSEQYYDLYAQADVGQMKSPRFEPGRPAREP